MHQLQIECREQGCGTVVNLTAHDLSEDKEVPLDEIQYYVDHRVPSRCGICFGKNWGALGAKYIEPQVGRQWASVS